MSLKNWGHLPLLLDGPAHCRQSKQQDRGRTRELSLVCSHTAPFAFWQLSVIVSMNCFCISWGWTSWASLEYQSLVHHHDPSLVKVAKCYSHHLSHKLDLTYKIGENDCLLQKKQIKYCFGIRIGIHTSWYIFGNVHGYIKGIATLEKQHLWFVEKLKELTEHFICFK